MSFGKFKNVFKNPPTTTDEEDTNPPSDLRSGQEQERGSASNPGQTSATGRQNSTTAGQRKLPPGTGPGTTGKPAPESAIESDRQQTGLAAPATGDRDGTTTTTAREVSEIRKSTTSGHSGVLEDAHDYGHTSYNSRDAKPSGLVQEDTNQLNPVTHERVRYLETEEVQREKKSERHFHHIQHHLQPIVASETLPERSHDLIHPVTNVQEIHANKPEDNALFEGQVRQHQDTLVRSEKERVVIDKGTIVDEHVHHHIHHVIQPIIEKETIDRQRIRTTIPIHEVTHEAPVIHESQIHAAVPIERFLRDGGVLTGAIPQEDIRSRVLHGGHCTREVEGVADAVVKELKIGEGIGPDSTATTTDRTYVYTEHNAPHDRVDVEARSVDGPHRTASERERTEAAKPISIPNA